ncbi:MAG: YdeI/OmpD-associated family protein [Haliscomenobacter sp.]|uniref:YdeI/OmpD-associated family protein n=1 Tax=Haliscomenobacter sp. TaxID=2717303 RepID=UPI0029AD7689|nr:YdeI/OmpD-associated family protein [Haliscomenobacter sp.]MDX2069012.1 YdeI/OmpD-associated family protein [Haliscomenobacter sp.]
MPEKEIETFCPCSRQEWRQWLQENHQSKQSIWLIYYKKKTNIPSIIWSEAVDEALCFGWIDSTAKPIDEEKYMQFFTRRKPKSVWSKINKDKVNRLIEEDLMMPSGYASIEIAQKNGSWSILDEVEALIIPPDLEKAFAAQPGSKEAFLSLSKSAQKAWLHRLVMAKQAPTREKRIGELVAGVIKGKS